jgi:MFS family permease
MSANVGAYMLGVAAIVTAIVAAALHWPWPWWVFVIIGGACIIAGVLMTRRTQKQPTTAFIDGSPELLVAEDVFSNAENFVHGTPGRVFLRRIIHVPFGPWRGK